MPILSAGQIVVQREGQPAPRKADDVQEKPGQTDRAVPREGTALYVNGQRRKIGKKSQYLLDMLTLDD